MQLKRNEEINQLKYETLNEIRKFNQIDGTKKKRKHSKVKSIEKETEEESSILVNSFFVFFFKERPLGYGQAPTEPPQQKNPVKGNRKPEGAGATAPTDWKRQPRRAKRKAKAKPNKRRRSRRKRRQAGPEIATRLPVVVRAADLIIIRQISQIVHHQCDAIRLCWPDRCWGSSHSIRSTVRSALSFSIPATSFLLNSSSPPAASSSSSS